MCVNSKIGFLGNITLAVADKTIQKTNTFPVN